MRITPSQSSEGVIRTEGILLHSPTPRGYAARKLALYDGGKRVPAMVAAISDAVRWAEEMLREIDRRWPTQHEMITFEENFQCLQH